MGDLIYPHPLPTTATLKKYGLTSLEWLQLYNSHMGRCGICGRSFEGIRVNIDHVHVRGWKKMAPEERKRHIRGLLCYNCNKFMVMRGITSEKLYKGWQYMRAFETRITPQSLIEQKGKGLTDKPNHATKQEAPQRTRRRPKQP